MIFSCTKWTIVMYMYNICITRCICPWAIVMRTGWRRSWPPSLRTLERLVIINSLSTCQSCRHVTVQFSPCLQNEVNSPNGKNTWYYITSLENLPERAKHFFKRSDVLYNTPFLLYFHFICMQFHLSLSYKVFPQAIVQSFIEYDLLSQFYFSLPFC